MLNSEVYRLIFDTTGRDEPASILSYQQQLKLLFMKDGNSAKAAADKTSAGFCFIQELMLTARGEFKDFQL